MGRAFAGMREQVVIATKAGQRTAKAAMEELDLSLTRHKTDYIDLYQPHQVSQPEELDALLAPGGAMEALEKARAQGKIRSIGIASHSLEMARKLVSTGLFATIQFPYTSSRPRPRTTSFPRRARRAWASCA